MVRRARLAAFRIPARSLGRDGRGHSGLLHATTGAGKTYAVWFGALVRSRALGVPLHGMHAPPLGVFWLTPMRALAADTRRALQAPLDDLGAAWTLGARTGGTPASERACPDRRFPTTLITTPESLSLMLTREHAQEELSGVHTVVVDEWHELMGSKRGVQVQLALARLKRWNPQLLVWGLSAALGNLGEAMQVLLGHGHGAIVRGRLDKALVIDTLLPDNPGRFSWGGHLGKQMQHPVVEEIERSQTTLVFVNMRSQAEAWYQLLLEERPAWAGLVALHHGSLDREVRDWVELGLKGGRLKAVVATSSLDLGVDFLPVERVLRSARPRASRGSCSEPVAAVLSQELVIRRLAEVLRRMRGQRVEFVDLKVPSPFAFALMVERFREKLTTEKLKDRLDRLLREMEKEAARSGSIFELPRRSP